MLIALSSTGNSLKSEFDKRFGRAKGFIIYDTQSKEFDFIDNKQNLNASQGAGIQSAQNVASKGIKAVITGHCGPKAFSALSVAGIEIYNCEAQTIEQALEKFEKNELKKANTADVQSHWV